MQQADSSRSNSTLASRSVTNSSRPTRVCNRSTQEKRKVISFKALAAAVLLSATAATQAFAQAAIQEPGAFAFYYPNLDVLNGGRPTPAARYSPDWPVLKGTCASAGGGVSYCGDRYGSYDFAPDAFPSHHGRRHHRM
jgi:hypothetical protein